MTRPRSKAATSSADCCALSDEDANVIKLNRGSNREASFIENLKSNTRYLSCAAPKSINFQVRKNLSVFQFGKDQADCFLTCKFADVGALLEPPFTSTYFDSFASNQSA